jgi:hypothetical protein
MEYLRFKVTEFVLWKDLSYDEIIQNVIKNCAERYPNLVKLAQVSLVVVLSNASCERCFSQMKLMKGDHQTRMAVPTLHARMMSKFHAPAPEDKADVMALCKRVATVFFRKRVRVRRSEPSPR